MTSRMPERARTDQWEPHGSNPLGPPGPELSLGLPHPGYDLPPLRGLNQVPRRLVRAGSLEPPVLRDRRSPGPRPSASHLETCRRPNGGAADRRRTWAASIGFELPDDYNCCSLLLDQDTLSPRW